MKIQNKTMPAIIFGLITNLCLCFALMFIFSFLFYKTGKFPEFALEPIILVITGIGAFSGGYICGKIKHENGMFFGMMCAFIAFTVVFLSGLILAIDSVTLLTLIRLFLMLLTGAIGGIMGVNSYK